MKNLKTAAALCAAIMVLAFASGAEARKHRYHERPTPIDLAADPASLNGTYEIDRLVLKSGDKIIVDSDDGRIVRDDKGELAFEMTVGESIKINAAFKMQMAGESFSEKQALAPYAFIYDKKSYDLPYKPGSPISDALLGVGMHIYGYREILWELPFRDGITMILKLKKETDRIMPVTDTPYMKYR